MHNRTIKEIDQLLSQIDSLTDSLFLELNSDSRKGVQLLVQKHQKRILKFEELVKQHNSRLTFEHQLEEKGYRLIAGVDEVGRGPLAGPVVAAAVILDYDDPDLIGITDSKQLSASKRKSYCDIIKSKAISYAISVVDSKIIDQINIYEASKLAMLQSVQKLAIQAEYLLIDAMVIDSAIKQMSIVKGDQRSLSIAAASIIAKEYRDQLMFEYSQIYPEFAFDKNVGYGTKEHLDALAYFGKTPIHRESFAPVANTKKIFQPTSE